MSAMAKTLNLQIVTPEGIAYSDDVEIVGLRSTEGQIGILPNHIRLMTQMVPGEMMVRKEGQTKFLAVGEGLVEVTDDRVAILPTWRLQPKPSMRPKPKKHACGPGSAPRENFCC